MRVPSATGLVFGALAFSGSTLSAPTPSSPIPSSPNPNAMDSPRMADSPVMHSPLLSARWLSASPAIRDGSGRRRSLPRNSRRDDKKTEKKPKAGEVSAQGLGLLPQPVKDAVGGLLNTVDGVVAGLPVVGGLLGHTVGDTGKSLLDALDVKDKDKKKDKKSDKKGDKKPRAPSMARSVAHIDARDEQAKDIIHDVEGLPIVGGTLTGVVNTVNGILEPKPRAFPRRQLAPPAMQAPAPVSAVPGVALGTASTLPPTIDGLAATVGNTIPVLGPIVEGILHTVAETVDTVVPRALPASLPDFVDQALPTLPVAPPSTPDLSALLDPALGKLAGAGLPTNTLSAGPSDTPAAGVVTVPVSLPIPGSALRAIGVPLGVVSGARDTAINTAGGPARLAQGTLSTVAAAAPAAPVAPAAPAGPRSRRGLTDSLNGTPLDGVAKTVTGSTPLGGVINTAGGVVSGTPVGGLINTAGGVISSTPAGGVLDTATGMVSGTPVGGLKDTLTGTVAKLPVLGAVNTVKKQAGGVPNTVTGAASGVPVADTLSTVSGTIVSSPVGGVAKTAQGIVGGVPLVGGLFSTVTGAALGVAGGAPVVGNVASGLGSSVGAKSV